MFGGIRSTGRLLRTILHRPLLLRRVMERRPYFVLGDILANGVTGALVAAACTSTIGETVPMILAMPVGMMLGGMLAMLLAAGLTVAFGAFEVMLPVMTTGMLVG